MKRVLAFVMIVCAVWVIVQLGVTGTPSFIVGFGVLAVVAFLAFFILRNVIAGFIELHERRRDVGQGADATEDVRPRT